MLMRPVIALWCAIQRIPMLVMDGLIAALVAGFGIFILAVDGGQPPDRVLTWFTYAWSIVMAVPLVLRRRATTRATAAVLILAAIYQLAESPADLEATQWLPLMFALYAVSAYADRRRDLLLAFLAYEILIGVNADAAPLSGQSIGNTTSAIAAIAIGAAMRGRRERAALAEQRRAEEAQRMVVDERMRIARELHDVIAHSIATINVQAGMASHVFDSQPEEARAALREIRQVSKDALRELRATLGVLRSAGEADSRAPSPHLDQLDDLLARARSAGVGVTLSVIGAHRDLPAAVDLAAYRVVQEALTNVVRHAGRDAQATIAIAYDPDRVEVRITDSGPPFGQSGPNGTSGSKLGLIGMRERVEGLGGELRTGPRGGGFEVHALLPTGEAR
jgi:signal transduction histidine kinase